MSFDDDERLKRRPTESQSNKCDQCDKHPSVWCPSCPRRMSGDPKRDDQGFSKLYKDDPSLARIQIKNARAAKVLSTTHESHPAYPMLEQAYIDAGVELMELWESRRRAN